MSARGKHLRRQGSVAVTATGHDIARRNLKAQMNELLAARGADARRVDRRAGEVVRPSSGGLDAGRGHPTDLPTVPWGSTIIHPPPLRGVSSRLVEGSPPVAGGRPSLACRSEVPVIGSSLASGDGRVRRPRSPRAGDDAASPPTEEGAGDAVATRFQIQSIPLLLSSPGGDARGTGPPTLAAGH